VVGPPPPTWAIDPAAARAFEVLPGLWQLRLPTPWEHMSHVNAFAIDHADGGIVLVDTGGAGHPSVWATFEHVLGLAGRSVSDIRDIVVTHLHSDHVGLAGPLAAESGATVWTHPARAHLFDAIEEPDAVYERRLAFARSEGVPEEWQDAVASIAEELDGVEAVPRGDRELVDGVTIDTALGDFEVIETPGHAPSHVGLYQPERRILALGDLVSPVFTTYCDWGYSDDPIGEYRASLERVAALDVALALPSHGRPTEQLSDLVHLYRGGFEQRLAAVASASGAGAWAVSQEAFAPPEFRPVAAWNFYEAAAYVTHAAG
jgi:glyoxylase-like metal-dependent hydrolase (beta-lactamase superfamily II)